MLAGSLPQGVHSDQPGTTLWPWWMSQPVLRQTPPPALVFGLLLLLVQRTDYALAFASRETMWHTGLPYGAKPPHRVALIGDFLSWDSADFKLRAAIEMFGGVEESLSLQVDEVEEDLLALQLRSFDPDTMLISVRARAFEGLVQSIVRTARAECKRGDTLVVLVFHLQAHAIPAADRAFTRVVTEHADGSRRVDRYAARVPPGSETLRLFVDNWASLDADDLRDAGLMPEWFGPSVPEWWCTELPCDQTPCAGSEALHDIVVYVGARDCRETKGLTSEGCGVAEFVKRKYAGKRILILQASNASAAEAHSRRLLGAGRTVERKFGQNVERVDREGDGVTRKLLTSAKLVVIPEAGEGGGSILALQHAIETMVLGGAAVVMSEAIIPEAASEDVINGTNALVFKAGDLDGLGHLLDDLLADDEGKEEAEDDGRRFRAGAGPLSTPPRCWLRQRACEYTCVRHSALQKLSSIISEAHAREELEAAGIIARGKLSVVVAELSFIAKRQRTERWCTRSMGALRVSRQDGGCLFDPPLISH